MSTKAHPTISSCAASRGPAEAEVLPGFACMSDRAAVCAESLPGIGERCSLEQLHQPGHPLGVPLLPRHSVNLPLVPKSSNPARQSPEWPADPRAALMEPLWDSEGSEGKHVFLSSVSVQLGLLRLDLIWSKGSYLARLWKGRKSVRSCSSPCRSLKNKKDNASP